MEWPAEWVYKSAFGDEWKAKIKERVKTSPLDMLEDEDLEKIRRDLSAAINREPSEEKIILIRMAKGLGDIAAPINGNIWRIGNPERGAIKAGDIVHKGEEIANLEAMKMENAIIAPFNGQIVEICAKLNDTVQEGQLLFVIEKQHLT